MGWGAWRGAGCRDRPRLGRCASVSLHICGRMNQPTDVGSQGQAVTPATQRCAGAGRSRDAWPPQGSEGAAGVHHDGSTVAGLTFDTQAVHKTTLTSCTYCRFRWDPQNAPADPPSFGRRGGGGNKNMKHLCKKRVAGGARSFSESVGGSLPNVLEALFRLFWRSPGR